MVFSVTLNENAKQYSADYKILNLIVKNGGISLECGVDVSSKDLVKWHKIKSMILNGDYDGKELYCGFIRHNGAGVFDIFPDIHGVDVEYEMTAKGTDILLLVQNVIALIDQHLPKPVTDKERFAKFAATIRQALDAFEDDV